MKESATRVQVSVRIRPPPSGNNDPNAISAVNAASLIAMDEKGSRREFKFDRVFTGDQSPVFETIGRPMLAEAFKGFNVCLFAYGQTGSGKTHSLLGDVENEQQQGVAPRFARSLFEEAQRMVEESDDLTIKISLSMIEVYMEKIRDLLVPRQRGVEPESLDIHEDAERRVYVKDVSVHHVMNFERMMDLLRKGNANRQTAETKMNETSSRSHAIMQITISQEFQSVEKRDLECMVSLVDLAGSERQTKTDTSGQRFEESKKINYSLMMLGRAMKAFSERKNNEAFISLRESKLTRLLSESFGGNSKTWMLATVSPGVPNYSESISTLEYATNAMAITNKAIVNVNRCLKEMSHEELSKIRNALAAAVQKESSEADALSAKCCEVRMEVENLKRDWTQFDQLKSIEREIAEALDDRNKLLRSLSCELRRHVTSSTERLICFSGTCKTSFACVPMGSYEIVTLGVPFYSVVGPPPLLECHLHLNVTADGDVVAIVKITTVEHVPDFATGGVQISIWFLERGGSKVLTPVVQPQEGSASFDYMQTYVFGPMTDNLKEYLQGESLMIQVDGLLEELA